MARIEPTKGRIVWFHGGTGCDIEPAMVAYVNSDGTVNLAVARADGFMYSARSALLVQEDDPVPQDGRYCEWMPYQKGQAQRHEALDPTKR